MGIHRARSPERAIRGQDCPLIEILQSEERWAEVLDWGMRWIGLGGWPEPAYRVLMTAYASNGDVSKAVATYERYAQALEKEMGVSHPSRHRRSITAQGGLEDRQSGAGMFPDNSTCHGSAQKTRASFALTQGTPYQPAQASDELHRASEGNPAGRAPGFNCPAGHHHRLRRCGQDRLAIRVASDLPAEYADGVWLVEFAPLQMLRSYPSRRLHHGRSRTGGENAH